MLRLVVNPDHPEPRKIRRAVEALEAGEVIAYPTDTVYGLGCDINNKKAVIVAPAIASPIMRAMS